MVEYEPLIGWNLVCLGKMQVIMQIRCICLNLAFYVLCVSQMCACVGRIIQNKWDFGCCCMQFLGKFKNILRPKCKGLKCKFICTKIFNYIFLLSCPFKNQSGNFIMNFKLNDKDSLRLVSFHTGWDTTSVYVSIYVESNFIFTF